MLTTGFHFIKVPFFLRQYFLLHKARVFVNKKKFSIWSVFNSTNSDKEYCLKH
jgi:hypothetical protein